MRRQIALFAVLAAAAFAAGCRPNYPACKNDKDCNRDKPRGEFCVNQLCQQCRNDNDCQAGQQCNKGRCEAIAGWCDTDAQCPPEQTCKDHRCAACERDDECGEGGKCRAGRCIRQGMCDTDDDCPEGQDCKGGRCVSAAARASQDAPCNLSSIYFDFNESGLTSEATSAIDANLACIKRVGRAVQLIGRTDPRGTEEYNLALSERRAQEVQTRLNRLGLDQGKLRVLPKGELEATGNDEAGWAQDRRVDFEWQ